MSEQVKKPKPKKVKKVQRSLWRERMKKKGRCLACGQPKNKSPYKGTCVACAEKKRIAQRHKRGNRSHAQSGRGRPPLVFGTR